MSDHGAAGLGLVLALWLALVSPSFGGEAQAPRAPVVGRTAAAEFVGALHRVATAEDRPGLAALMHYPLTIWASGITIPVADRTAFLKYYDSVMTPAVIAAIGAADAAARAGRFGSAALRVGEDRIVIGANVATATIVGGRLGVTRITLPSLDRGWRAARSDAQRLSLRVDGTPTRVSGALARGESETYLVVVPRGRRLALRLNEVAGRTIVARLLDARGGTPLDARADQGVRAWTGRFPSDRDLRIVVTRLAGTEPALGYLLAVSLE